jgi:beta-xylosidase
MNLHRRLLFPLLLLVALMTASPALCAPPDTYTNPFPISVADPFVLQYGKTYYLTGTSADDGFQMWTSPDLVHWIPHGYCFRRTLTSWGHDNFWAPALLQRNGIFYLYYSSRGKVSPGHDSMRICVATSRSPLGPYVDAAAPMFDIGKATIDVHVILDTDGRGYLYYVKDCSENFTAAGKSISEIYVLPLNPDLISVRQFAKPIFCIRPSQAWEGGQWNEGPFVFKHGRTYIMMYSANFFASADYALGYATASSPLGPWAKAKENPVLHQTATVKGPGHNAVIPSPDGKELFCIYHEIVTKPQWDRNLAIDRMKITDLPDGRVKLRVLGPTDTPQPLPSGSPTTLSPVH